MITSGQFNTIRWANLDLFVTHQTFIPRKSSLGFLEVADEILNVPCPPRILIDMCCGSGALGIAVYRSRPEFFDSVLFLDSSPDAVLSAEANRAAHRVPGRVLLWRAGEPLPVSAPAAVICNPPFLDELSSENLPDWERSCVSCASDGFSVIADCLRSIGKSKHSLLLKCLPAQLAAVRPLLESGGCSCLRLTASSEDAVISAWSPGGRFERSA
ncbi:MAG TPA: methyltransferase [Bryobacteraceae bacterium]|jgi:methylase of polypeptide subunit release factors|nr:methyltransferase [Bryobacteraceae bacterium]